ncbi:ABC transporter permease subunit [uncultured Brevibacillus sp.]|uniref:ABC transporter permease subunit n=1 Tax=uncultured Brevibacillus sp. TaxID=169970 RepID=UPI002592E70A|nr:ABC transporter permease subunit [uncultured Brevibacillus sp.]
METPQTVPTSHAAAFSSRTPGTTLIFWSRFRRNPLTLVGGVIFLLFVLIALLAPILSTYDPELVQMSQSLKAPSTDHWFGTDEVGRDLFSRVVYGTRLSLGMGISIILISGLIGILLGAVAGYRGGTFGQIIMRMMDIILAFPTLILAMALSAALGPSLLNAILAIVIVKIPAYVRLARSETLVVKEKLFVKAARTFGLSDSWIIIRHIIPNIITPVIIQMTLDLGDAILLVATLGFLGLGVQPPTPEWGSIINTGWKYFLDQWWYPTFPGIAIFLVTISFNILGDGLRDMLDPKSAR